MAFNFIKPFHHVFSYTSTNLLISKTFPVASGAVVKISPPTSFINRRSLHHDYATCTLYTSQESSETEINVATYTPNPWVKSGPTSPIFLKEEDDVVKAKVDCPAMGQNDVKVWIEKSAIFIVAMNGRKVKADEDVDVHDYDMPRTYSGFSQLPEGPYKLDEAEFMVKNGVVDIMIPKIRFQ